jgi:hypothetical protein
LGGFVVGFTFIGVGGIAIGGDSVGSRLGIWIADYATRICMKSDRIGVLVIDPFYDVNLSTSRPVGTEHPESRPDTASGWHVLNIRDDKSLPFRMLVDIPEQMIQELYRMPDYCSFSQMLDRPMADRL